MAKTVSSLTYDPEQLYVELGHLLSNPPDVSTIEARSQPGTQRWLSKVFAIVQVAGPTIDSVQVMTAMNKINGGATPEGNLRNILTCAWRTLGLLELQAPAAAHGAFIGAGNDFDAIKAFGAAVAGASTDVLIVDPYMDEKALTDFATLVPEGTPIRLLAEEGKAKASLKPSTYRWQTQYTTFRPLLCRLAPHGILHDRLIIADGVVWLVSQSFNALAKRSPATIVKIDEETAALKVEAYSNVWDSASPI